MSASVLTLSFSAQNSSVIFAEPLKIKKLSLECVHHTLQDSQNPNRENFEIRLTEHSSPDVVTSWNVVYPGFINTPEEFLLEIQNTLTEAAPISVNYVPGTYQLRVFYSGGDLYDVEFLGAYSPLANWNPISLPASPAIQTSTTPITLLRHTIAKLSLDSNLGSLARIYNSGSHHTYAAIEPIRENYGQTVTMDYSLIPSDQKLLFQSPHHTNLKWIKATLSDENENLLSLDVAPLIIVLSYA